MSGDLRSLEHRARVVAKPIDDVNGSSMAVPKPPPLSTSPKIKITPTAGMEAPVSKQPVEPSRAINPFAQAAPSASAPAEGPAEKVKRKHTKKKAFGGINRDTSEYIIESLSMLLLAGVTVGEAIDSIAKEIPQKGPRETMMRMKDSIDEGVPFARALEETGLFNTSVITLIEVGESTGKLPENLKVVAAQMHKNNTMNAKIKSAMLYPAFLVTLLFVVGTGIGVFLLPKLLNIITGLQIEVGAMTKILIVVGTWFGKYGLIFAAGTVISVIFLSILIKKSSAARGAAEVVLYRIPGIKKLLFETEMARFGFVLGTLLDAGLPVVTALDSLAASMSTKRYARFAAEIARRVDEGDSFDKILSDKKYRSLLPGTITQVVVSAEKSGNLSSSLLKIGNNYEDKADLTAHNLETLLEPIVLVLIAAAVLFVAMAVFLPIYSLIGNLNGA
ncbi:MAG: type pilus assembly protein PilC [Patescibacteria group bacterium]|nr:type pilus assembly protein PilC [Patescibacteria group bacterium]